MRRPAFLKIQEDGWRCSHCGEEFSIGEGVYWRQGDGGSGLFHPKCPSPVSMEREACLQMLEYHIKLLETKLEAFGGVHASVSRLRCAVENLTSVRDEIVSGGHIGMAVWPPPERDDVDPETWRLLADTACEILGRGDVHQQLLPEDRDDANKAFEMLGRLVDKTEAVEKS